MKNELITTDKELRQLVKDGLFFQFCIAFALNKGYKDVIKEKKEVKFTVGDYNVEMDHIDMYFKIEHKEYFARIIHAHYNFTEFTGESEKEVIAEFLAEVEKELKPKFPADRNTKNMEG